MSTILTHATIENAKDVVKTYITTVNGIRTELDGIISGLTSANFNGDASDGYMVFYNQTVTPAIKENLTEPGSIMASVDSMLETIKTQLLDQVDPQLGENNKNPGVSN